MSTKNLNLEHSLDYIRSRLFRGATITLTAKICVLMGGFISHLVLARALSVQEYGLFSLVFTWVTVLSQISTLGFQQTLVRFISSYRAIGQYSALAGLIQFAERRCLVSAVCIALIGVFMAQNGFLNSEENSAQAWFVGLSTIPLLTLLIIRKSISRGLEKILSANFAEQPVRHAVVICGVLLITSSAHIKLSASVVFLLLACGFALGLLWLTLVQWQALKAIAPRIERKFIKSEWWRSARPFFVLMILQLILSQIDILLLGWLSDTRAVGLYSVASRVAVLTSFPLTAVNFVFAPIVSNLHTKKDSEGLQKLITISAWSVFVITLTFSLGLLMISEYLLQLFGESYILAARPLEILIAGNILNAAAGSVLLILNMTGNERYSVISTSLVVLFYIISAPLLIEAYDIVGSAIARTASLIALNVLAGAFVWRKVHIVPGILRIR